MARAKQIETIMMELNNIENWKKTSKKNYDVYVCRPKFGSKVRNRLEGANYETNEKTQFVISGTVGETWVIDFNKLAKTYTFMDGSAITTKKIMERAKSVGDFDFVDWMHLKTAPGGGAPNWAFHLPLEIKNFPVQTSCGNTLYANRSGIEHGKGDFIVCADKDGRPNIKDMWVVNGLVFPTTYDMRSFPGLSTGMNKVDTPVPKSILGKIKEVQAKPVNTPVKPIPAPAKPVDVAETKPVKQTKPSQAPIKKYSVIARYMKGTSVEAYAVKDLVTFDTRKVYPDQLYFLIGRGVISNCEADIYKDKVNLRGIDIKISELPVINEDGKIRDSEALGKIKKGLSAEQAVLIGSITSIVQYKNNTVGYEVTYKDGTKKQMLKDEAMAETVKGLIANARVNKNGANEPVFRSNDKERPFSSYPRVEASAEFLAKVARLRNKNTENQKNEKSSVAKYKPVNIVLSHFQLDESTNDLTPVLIELSSGNSDELLKTAKTLEEKNILSFYNSGFDMFNDVTLCDGYKTIIDDNCSPDGVVYTYDDIADIAKKFGLGVYAALNDNLTVIGEDFEDIDDVDKYKPIIKNRCKNAGIKVLQ